MMIHMEIARVVGSEKRLFGSRLEPHDGRFKRVFAFDPITVKAESDDRLKRFSTSSSGLSAFLRPFRYAN